MTGLPALPAFSACGIELEYMIVDRERLDVRPIADELLRAPDGRWRNDVERGSFGWSNELAAHLVEIKNEDPREPLLRLRDGFGGEVAEVNDNPSIESGVELQACWWRGLARATSRNTSSARALRLKTLSTCPYQNSSDGRSVSVIAMRAL